MMLSICSDHETQYAISIHLILLTSLYFISPDIQLLANHSPLPPIRFWFEGVQILLFILTQHPSIPALRRSMIQCSYQWEKTCWIISINCTAVCQPRKKKKKWNPSTELDEIWRCRTTEWDFNTKQCWPHFLSLKLCSCFCAVLVCAGLWNTAGLEGKSNKMIK